jgi:hypothetical protein
MVGVLLGLTLAACGGDSTGEDGASMSASESNGESTTMDPGMTNTSLTMSTTSTNMSTSTGPPDGEASVAAYGGPDVDTAFDTSPDDETADTGTTGTDTGTGTGTGGTSTG